MRLYVGTWMARGGTGILSATWSENTGILGRLALATTTPNPTFLTLHPQCPLLYVVNEVAQRGDLSGGGVSTFKIDAVTGDLLPMETVSAGGKSPTHLEVSPDGATLAVALYHGAGVALFPLNPAGRIAGSAQIAPHTVTSIHLSRQNAPHPHGTHFTPDGNALLVPDLGGDEIVIYVKTPSDPQHPFVRIGSCAARPGSGPRHLAFHPDGNATYVVHELSNTLSVLSWDRAAAHLQVRQEISLLPENFHGASAAAEVAVHPSGRFVYASNRGADSIAVFPVEPTGRIGQPKGYPVHGRSPRHFVLARNGAWLLAANQDSDTVNVFEIDQRDGGLSLHSSQRVTAPVCLAIYYPDATRSSTSY